MTDEEYYIAKVVFKNRVYAYTGQEFEDFFTAIMTKYNSDFKPIKPYGNVGDMKNDGFDAKAGTYYQVFSPEEITKVKTVKVAIAKMQEDFEGLYSKWNDSCPIKKFYFVINDKFKGISPLIEQEALRLDKIYKEVEIYTFLAKDLESVFSQLPKRDIQDIVGFVPTAAMEIVQYEALSETVKYLMNIDSNIGNGNSLVVPDFDNKILFNGLSKAVNDLLISASYQDGILRKYFNADPGLSVILQTKFHALYELSIKNISDEFVKFSDSRFFFILENACVKRTIAVENSVLVLMAHYFASCDIFEGPTKYKGEMEGGK